MDKILSKTNSSNVVNQDAPVINQDKPSQSHGEYIPSKTEGVNLNDKVKPDPKDLKLETVDLSTFYNGRFTSMKTVKSRQYGKNHFLNTIMTSYNLHLALHLYPEDIHFAVQQMITDFINKDPERFRDIFVTFSSDYEDTDAKHADIVPVPKGKKRLAVDIDALNTEVTKDKDIWALALTEWTRMIGKEIKEPKYIDYSAANYSTSSFTDLLTSYGYIMDSTKAYFDFYCYCLCGIPKVYLQGTIQDWEMLYEKIKCLSEFIETEIGEYIIENILPIIEKFIDTKKGNPDKEWWEQIINHRYAQEGSGSAKYWSGWIINFFPHVKESGSKWGNKNSKEPKKMIVEIPSKLETSGESLTSVPITFNKNGNILNLTLRAGTHGTEQLSDGSVRTIRGYYLIRDEDLQKTKNKY